jgi:uncharacterized membrane protein
MKTPASIAGHPIHPMLVPLAIGLWIAFGASSESWRIVALYTLAGGIVGALLAAVPGFIDMLSIPWPTKRTALISGWLGAKTVYEEGVGVGRS